MSILWEAPDYKLRLSEPVAQELILIRRLLDKLTDPSLDTISQRWVHELKKVAGYYPQDFVAPESVNPQLQEVGGRLFSYHERALLEDSQVTDFELKAVKELRLRIDSISELVGKVGPLQQEAYQLTRALADDALWYAYKRVTGGAFFDRIFVLRDGLFRHPTMELAEEFVKEFRRLTGLIPSGRGFSLTPKTDALLERIALFELKTPLFEVNIH